MTEDKIKLSKRAFNALKKLDSGFVESEGDLPGVGPKTYEELLKFNLIAKAICKIYDTIGHEITSKGKTYLDEQYSKKTK